MLNWAPLGCGGRRAEREAVRHLSSSSLHIFLWDDSFLGWKTSGGNSVFLLLLDCFDLFDFWSKAFSSSNSSFLFLLCTVPSRIMVIMFLDSSKARNSLVYRVGLHFVNLKESWAAALWTGLSCSRCDSSSLITVIFGTCYCSGFDVLSPDSSMLLLVSPLQDLEDSMLTLHRSSLLDSSESTSSSSLSVGYSISVRAMHFRLYITLFSLWLWIQEAS